MSTGKPLTADVLDRFKCMTPGCHCPASEGVVLNPRCHVGAGLTVRYADGVMRLWCRECGEAVVEIAVARSE